MAFVPDGIDFGLLHLHSPVEVSDRFLEFGARSLQRPNAFTFCILDNAGSDFLMFDSF